MVEGVVKAVNAALETIGPVIMFLLDHLQAVLTILGVAGLVKVADLAITVLVGLGKTFIALAAQIEVATAAQLAFNAATAAASLKSAGIGAAVGGLTTGGLGGTIGGAGGGILGGIAGSFFGPVGTFAGRAIGGYLGGKLGGAIENHFHTEVTVEVDHHAAAAEIASKIEPKIRESHQQVVSLAGAHKVARAVGGRGPAHYHAGY
jgi:hypothetical protein